MQHQVWSKSNKFCLTSLVVSAATGFGMLATPVQAANLTSTWNNTSGNWSDTSRWNNGVPNNTAQNTYNAIIPVIIPPVSVTLDQNVNINSLQLNGGSLTAINSFNLNVSNFSLTNPTAILQGTVNLTASGLANWTGGTMRGTGTTNFNGSLNLGGSSNTINIQQTRTVNNTGTANWTGNVAIGVQGSATATFNNQNTGVFNIQTDADWTGPTFHNAGILSKTAGNGETKFTGTFTNSGTVRINSGSLTFNNFTQTAGTTLLAGGTLGSASGSTNPLTFSGGNLNGSGDINGNVLNNGSIDPGLTPNSTGSFTLNGNLNLQTNSLLNFDLGGVNAFDSLDVNGTAVLGGILNVNFLNGFENLIKSTDTFTLLSANFPLTGAFNNVTSGGRLSIGSTGSFLVNYDDNRLTLSKFQSTVQTTPELSPITANTIPVFLLISLSFLPKKSRKHRGDF